MTTVVDFFRSDFNGDNLGDILWRDRAGDNVLWLMNGNTPSTMATLPVVTPDWHFKAANEFDHNFTGPHLSDILWQNDNGALALWQMDGTTVSAIHALGPNPGPTWHVVGDNNFDVDFSDDILFQNDNGALAIWTITSASAPTITGMFAGTQNPGPTWHVVGTGDTTNVGDQAGILWQNDNGSLAFWENPTFAAGTFTFNTVAALPTVDASWHVKGMADINGNGTSDIVFQNDSGAVAVWLSSPGSVTFGVTLINLNPGPDWHIVGLRNMNGGGADILFQNDNGAAAVWEDYHVLPGGLATFNTVLPIDPNPNPNGHVWDLL